MSTPSDPRSGGHQADDPSGAASPSDGPGQQPYPQPGQYGQQQPPGYGQAPAYNPYPQQGQPPQYGQPGQYGQYGGQPGQYGPYGQPQAYNPYGQPGQYAGTPFGGEAAGLGPGDGVRVARPGIMILPLVLLIISTLPYIAGGALLVALVSPDVLPPGFDEQMAQSGLTGEQGIAAVRGLGGIALVLGLLYIVFAVLAFMGHNWARIAVTIMTVLFAGLMLLFVVSGIAAGEVVGALLFLVPVVMIVGAVAVMFMPEPNRWFRGARR